MTKFIITGKQILLYMSMQFTYCYHSVNVLITLSCFHFAEAHNLLGCLWKCSAQRDKYLQGVLFPRMTIIKGLTLIKVMTWRFSSMIFNPMFNPFCKKPSALFFYVMILVPMYTNLLRVLFFFTNFIHPVYLKFFLHHYR